MGRIEGGVYCTPFCPPFPYVWGYADKLRNSKDNNSCDAG